ncbi:uncharacterized protein LOC124634685 [Helicoverpa zea]|uniref:uncharacterized protein LOC124634685 n=1 Tax=Helicoverpa zea TaxID=7113 RepID=UPI001F5AE63A|nr:uncharacterized protein LOC124634685 [Helicoverpa zea]
MALKRLSNDVQSLLSASAHVNNFKRAIEELIYNSLDAESTSIAIRIYIEQSSIQVIDNGCGIAKHDFNLIGQRHVTSKVNNIEELKAAPKNYGFRGEFLANIITISQIVKITSRHLGTEDTWAKTFCDGKEKKFAKMTMRPSNGTTVDVKGFLHNLNIQRRGIDAMNEMQNIKLFLEQISLAHNNVSISLRDDSKNEIVFKIHKKRDIYQTLSTLFDINKSDAVELQVEKHEYKVKGLIGKTDKVIDLHWIYLNGKCMHSSSKLHKMVNEYLKRSLHIKDPRRLKLKTSDENQLFNQNIPFYFIFLTCPYIDYEISLTPKQSVVEFKEWEQVTKLLDKLIKFYVGDVAVKEIKVHKNACLNNNKQLSDANHDTRNQVKKIIEKILGSNSKKIGVSQLQNGVKGKLIKRKAKKKAKPNDTNHNIQQTEIKHNSHRKTTAKTNADRFSEPRNEHIQALDSNLDKSPIPELKNEVTKVPNIAKNLIRNKSTEKRKKEIKNKISSPAKVIRKTVNKIHKDIIKSQEHYLHSDTDSVYKRNKIVAQKVEDFLPHGVTKKTRANKQSLEKRNRKANKRELEFKIREKNRANNENKLELLKLNKYIVNKLKAKSYKTTYDLIQTVLGTQQEVFDVGENNFSEELYTGFKKPNDGIHFISKRRTWTNKCVLREYSNRTQRHRIDIKNQFINESPTRFRVLEYEDNFTNHKTEIQFSNENPFQFEEPHNNFSKNQSPYDGQETSNAISNVPPTFESVTREFYNAGRHFNCTQRETSFQTMSGPLTILTYDSHGHHKNEVFLNDDIANCDMTNRKHNTRFITKQSKDNFITSNDLNIRFKKSRKPVSRQPKMYDLCMRQRINETLYTIEYTKSNESCHYTEPNHILVNNATYVKEKANVTELPIIDRAPAYGNTYTLSPSHHSFDLNTITQIQQNSLQNRIHSHEMFGTYTIDDSDCVINNDYKEPNTGKNDCLIGNNNVNIVFVSKSQRTQTETSKNVSIEPLNWCETVLNEIETGDAELPPKENDRLNDSLYDNFINNDDGIDEWVANEVGQIIQDNAVGNVTEDVSHHFVGNNKETRVINNEIIIEEPPHINNQINYAEKNDCNYEINHFNVKNRHRFVPKGDASRIFYYYVISGMSQIFEHCRTKGACDYKLDEEYYEDVSDLVIVVALNTVRDKPLFTVLQSIYNNFAKDVQVNTEIYEPVVQNVEDHATKNIHKFESKVKKDNASLIFDETSLKDAKVLGQVDCKFIAAIMKKRSCETKETAEYLILFDQHAVHERIRLERNLADYLNEDKWATVAVENVVLKMSNNQILYLHNYKDKFAQLGLQWTINDKEVNVHSIPEAILGKNPREVEKVIKAVRNLIIEEINVMKMQKGCLSLYPKSIMDLVFSEACRYAIKFGDQLSKNECIKLLHDLSNCKTPFQCAHGRPVMAVIMDSKAENREYKINMSKLKQFKRVK